MKKLSKSRFIILVLSIALLIGSAFAVTAAAEEDDTTGKFSDISIAYADKVAITVAVDATKEELERGDVVVSYSIDGASANATYFRTDDKGTVWVITKGIAAYDLAEVVTFSSTVNGAQVESDRKYSVAQFVYKTLYTKTLDDIDKNFYTTLLAFGEAAQHKSGNTDSMVTDSTLAFTKNADISFDGSKTAFAPASDMDLTPSYNGDIPVGKIIIGWNVIENGEEKVVDATFHCSGIVEVLSPVLKDEDPSKFTLANGGFEDGLTGWTVVGSIGDVSSDTHYWTNENGGYAFGMDGNMMFSAYAPGALETAAGTLTSSSFTIGGTGFVTFKVGAMKDGNYVYVDVVDASTMQILARYYNGLWADTTDGVKSGCTLVPYKADLSAYMGREVFFRISDNADSGYGLFFADSFNTYHVTEPDDSFNTATPVNYEISGTAYDLFNGGFEYGDNRGWWNNGEIGVVTNATGYWNENIPYGKDGEYLYTGVQSFGADTMREGNVGALTSSVFQLGGSGYITYMLGGGNDYISVQIIDAATGEVLARYRQQAREDAVLKTYVADLTEFVGRNLRIQVVDNAIRDWGCVSFDNVKTYYAEKPEGIDAVDVLESDKYTIANGSFEQGMFGWNESVDLGAVVRDEIGDSWYTKNDGNKHGDYLFSFAYFNAEGGVVNTEGNTGTLESSGFLLKQNAYVSFRFGGAGGTEAMPNNHEVYIQLCNANGDVIATFYNDADKVNTRMNAYYYQYTGEETECFFRVVDNSTHDYGCFVVDDFRVNLESAPEGHIEAIQ